MVSFVRLTPADAALLARIGGVSLLESHGHSAPAEIMQAYVDRSFSEEACRTELQDAQNLFSAVLYNGVPAGYFKMILHTPHSLITLQPVAKLERLYLLKEFYGLNLGHALLQETTRIAKAANQKGLWLDVWKGNNRAVRFYQKEGFETVGESEFKLTESRTNPIWVMWLPFNK